MLDRMWDRCIGHWEQLSRLVTTVTYMFRERGTGRRLPGWLLSLLWRAVLLPAFWRDDRPGAEVVETITIGDSDRPTMGSRTEYKALVVNPAWPRDLETLFRPADPRQIPPDAVFSDLGRVGATSNLGTPMLIIGRGTAPDADSAVDGLVKWPRHPVTLRSEWADMDGDYFYLTIGDIYRSKETDFELPEDPAAGHGQVRRTGQGRSRVPRARHDPAERARSTAGHRSYFTGRRSDFNQDRSPRQRSSSSTTSWSSTK